MRQNELHPGLVWHSWLIFAVFGLFASQWVLPASLCAVLLFFLDRRLWSLPRLLCGIFIFVSAAFWAYWQFTIAEQIIARPPAWLTQKNQRFCGQIQYVQGLPGQRLRILLHNVHNEDGGESLPGICLWSWDKPEVFPLPGQSVCLDRIIRPVSGFANAKNNSYIAFLTGQNIYWRVWSRGDAGTPAFSGHPCLWQQLRQQLQRKFLAILDLSDTPNQPQAKAILVALVFGDRFFLQQSTMDVFADATLAHSLALSGQHLGVVGLIGYAIIMLMALACPNLYLLSPRSLLVLFASLPFAALYLWLGNAPASLQRAATMLFLATLWFWRRHNFSGIDLLCAALFLLVLFAPLSIFDTGLQLSVLCVAIILITWPALCKLLPRVSIRLPDLRQRILLFAGPILLISFIIQVALLPLTLSRFQHVGFLFPLNLLWLPVLSFIVLPLSFMGLLLAVLPFPICQFVAKWLLDVAAMPCQLLLRLLQLLKEHCFLQEPVFLHPHWSALVVFGLLVCGLAWIFGAGKKWRNGRLLLALALLLLAVGPAIRLGHAVQTRIRISALDVGQGESLLMELPDGQRLLLDGGGSYSTRFDPGRDIVAPIVSGNARPALDAVFNSHPDQDHVGGLLYILERMPVAVSFHNGRVAQTISAARWEILQRQKNAHILVKGDELILGKPQNGLRLEVLHPPANDAEWQGNGASLVLRLVRNGYGIALFPGDADKKALKYMLSHKNNLQADLVVAPHHGSDKELLAEFYKACRPKLVIACCGFLNHHHFPGIKTRDWLRKQKIPLLDTGNSGKITVEFQEDNKMKVEKMKVEKMKNID